MQTRSPLLSVVFQVLVRYLFLYKNTPLIRTHKKFRMSKKYFKNPNILRTKGFKMFKIKTLYQEKLANFHVH